MTLAAGPVRLARRYREAWSCRHLLRWLADRVAGCGLVAASAQMVLARSGRE